MKKRSGVVTMKGTPLTLLGEELNVGAKAPDVELVGNDMGMVRLSSFAGTVRVVSAVPSLDTPVCDRETRRFNEEAQALGDAVRVLTISMDLPFAQKRWCGAEGISNVLTLSDHRAGAFGLAYGVLLEELRLLARAVFVIDREGTVQYAEVVPEIAEEPSYEEILAAAKRYV
jgi:thiol peroxidase